MYKLEDTTDNSEGVLGKWTIAPIYFQLIFKGGLMKMPIGENEDITKVQEMFNKLLQIDGVKEIMERYGVEFEED